MRHAIATLDWHFRIFPSIHVFNNISICLTCCGPSVNMKSTRVLRFILPTRGTRLTRSRGLCTSQWLRQTKQDQVPVVTHDGTTSRTTLHVDRSHPVVDSRTSDEGREAQPFDKSVLSKLTPTMRSFALDGKIAVITG
jgi:hypothetical protein